MHCIAVNLDVPDIDTAVAFYRDVLGFREDLHIPDPDGTTRYATVTNGEATVMFDRADHVPAERRPYLGTGVTLYIDLGDGDVDAWHGTLRERGVTMVKPLRDEYWGARDFTIADNNGYHITFAQQIEPLSQQEMIANLLRMREL